MANAQQEMELDEFNQNLRANEEYRQFLRSMGVDPDRPIKLRDDQRKAAAQWLAEKGWTLPKGLEIDPAGNVNQDEGFGKQLKRWGPIVGAAAVTLFGIPGVLPGVLTAGGGAGATAGGAAVTGGTGGTLASSTIPGLHAAVPGAAVGGVTGGTAAGSGIMSSIGRFLGGGDGFDMGDLSDILGAGGAVMGAAGQQAANSRADQLNASVLQNEINRQAEDDFRRALAERERVGMETRNDARRNLQYGEYLAGGGSEYKAPEGTTAIGFGPKAATEHERTGGAALRDEANARLLGGNPMPEPVKNTYTIPQDLLRPGTFETVANVMSPGLSIFSMIDQIRRNRG